MARVTPAAAGFGLLLALHAPAAAQPLVITNASIVDTGRAQPLQAASVVVRDGVIVEISPVPRVPEGARIIDAAGKFVVPGLWDMHAHLAALTPIGRAPEHYVAHGVLNLRDMGGRVDELVALRSAIRAGVRTGPELVLAGPTLNSEQSADFHRRVTTADEARAAVRELKASGVDFIKIHRATNREAFEAIVDEARRQGLPVSGHVPLVMSWREASNAGMRTIEHVQTIFENIQPDPKRIPAEFDAIAKRLDGPLGDEIFAVMKANGTVFDPTLIGYESSFEQAAPNVAELRKAAYERMKPIAIRAARAGVPIVTGTDVLDRHGEMLLRELERLVEIGLTPREVLLAATATSAATAGRPELGRVAVGAPASFIVLDANPLEDIRNVRALSMVVLRGRVLQGEDLAALRR